jgi:cell division protein FtsW
MAIKEHYRMQRLLVFLNPYADPDGAGYQILQGLSALGSGGPLGLGLGESRAKWLYLPAEHTDFIYAIIGEEMGLLGTLGILGLFLVLVRRGFVIAGKCKNAFGTLLAMGIAMTIGLQAFMNIGVVTTLLPATGVPLPLISFGGSSLVLTLFALGVLADISRRPVLPWDNEDNDSRSNRRWDRGAYLSGAGDRRSARKARRNSSLYR